MNKAIECGYKASEWVGEMAMAYSPIMFFAGMAMATMSIALRGAIATNVAFGVLWAIITAICVDGLWLGIWLRVRSSKITSWATGLRYGAMVVIALFMALVCAAMSILVTYQQVNGISDELLGMNNLHIDSLTFTVARGVLVVLCATMAIWFRGEKQEAAPKKATPTRNTVKATVTTPQVKVMPVPATPVAIPAIAESIAHSPEYEKIKTTMATAIEDGKLSVTLQTIAIAAGVGYSTVKKHAPKIKEELGIAH